jgi:branched-chain amino acid transport system ATP-binding protein
MLEISEVTVRFGGLEAVNKVTAKLEKGRVLGLIGPNGSGKTTLLNTISGVHAPTEGTVTLDGHQLAGISPSGVAHRGLMRTFQVPRVFESLTVLENMMLPTIEGRGHDKKKNVQRARDLLAFVDLKDRENEIASMLSGGQQKLVEFARALMTDPKVVLMDEPFSGVHPRLIRVMTDRIAFRRKEGTSFVIVSHEIPPLMKVSDKVLCLNRGKVVCYDEPQRVVQNSEVIAAYLGRPADDQNRDMKRLLDV